MKREVMSYTVRWHPMCSDGLRTADFYNLSEAVSFARDRQEEGVYHIAIRCEEQILGWDE